MKHVCEIGIGVKPLYEDLLAHNWQGTFIEVHPIPFARAAMKYADTENLKLINVAISDSDGFEFLQTKTPLDIDPWCGLEKGNADNDRFHTSDRFKSDKYGFFVYAISLWSLMSQVPPMDLLSMDIQGSEFGVLQPDFALNPRLINVEIHNVSRQQDLKGHLESRGYEYIQTSYKYGDYSRPNDLFEFKHNRILHELSHKEKEILNV